MKDPTDYFLENIESLDPTRVGEVIEAIDQQFPIETTDAAIGCGAYTALDALTEELQEQKFDEEDIIGIVNLLAGACPQGFINEVFAAFERLSLRSPADAADIYGRMAEKIQEVKA